MAEEFQAGICGGSWWNLSWRSMFGSGCSSPCSAALNDMAGSYGWPAATYELDSKTRACQETNSVSDNSVVFQDRRKPDSGTVFMNSNLQMMGFGVSSSSPADWNQPLLCSDGRGDNNYSSILRDDMSSKLNYGQETGLDSSQIQKDFSPESQDSTLINPFNPANIVASSGNCTPTSSSYGYSSSLLQNLLGADHINQQQQSLSNAIYGTTSSQFPSSTSSWPRLSPFFKPSLPKLQFSNNTPFLKASNAPSLPSFLPQLQTQFLEDKNSFPTIATKRNVEEIHDMKKISGIEPALPFKRPRIETPSPLPTFKVRKEKLGDRITALQQLVSPFGKTDTASVLHEAIECIKFLHEQVSVLSTPYLKNGAAAIQQQPGSEQAKDSGEVQKQDLKSRGLCLVPISSTFPVANETTADFLTPTFGGTFRSIN